VAGTTYLLAFQSLGEALGDHFGNHSRWHLCDRLDHTWLACHIHSVIAAQPPVNMDAVAMLHIHDRLPRALECDLCRRKLTPQGEQNALPLSDQMENWVSLMRCQATFS